MTVQAIADSSWSRTTTGKAWPSLSVIVPTYREVDNLPELLRRVGRMRQEYPAEVELILVDDDSGDGTEEYIERVGSPWVRLVVRRQERGLSSAVLAGIRQARHEVFVVMDADLSHPPEKVPELVAALMEGADFAVGSRFIDGGSTDDDWGIFRWLNSRVATLLARPLTTISDPMSGFFAFSRRVLEQAAALNPVGYKIGLELIVKCGCRRVCEVPIHFADRKAGRSKLCLREQFRYLQHVRRLYIHRYGEWSYLAQFLTVGLSGTVVNLATLTGLLHGGVDARWAVALAIALSMVWNFALNRRFSFSYARGGSLPRQFAGFALACSAGALVNYGVTLGVLGWFPGLRLPQMAALLGIGAGLGFNFLVSRFWVFRKRHYAPKEK